MDVFKPFIERISDINHQEKVVTILNWIHQAFPQLVMEIKWSQPMFTDHGTYIIGLSIAKQHIAISPEQAGIIAFEKELTDAKYDYTNMIFRIKWNQEINFELLKKIIEYNIKDKATTKTFWR